MKSRTLLTVLLPLAFAGAAAVLATKWIDERLGTQQASADLSSVAAAAVNIGVGTKLDPTHLKRVQLPPASVPEGSFTSLDDVIGQVARQPIYQGEILLKRRVAEHAAGSPLSAVIEEGKRAITVRVNDVIGVAGFLLPGSRVDIISTNRDGESRTILENIRVLAVDQTTAAEKDSPVVVRAVTLEVDPIQAEIVVKATQIGNVQLTLRNPLDAATVVQLEQRPTAETSEPTVTAVAQPELPIELESLYSVDVVRGIEVTTTTVRN